MLGQAGGKRFGIQDDLPLIIAELGLKRFMKTNSFRRNHVHQRTALNSGENGRINLFRESLFAHHDTATRTAQTLVRGRGDQLRVRNWTWMLAACDKT